MASTFIVIAGIASILGMAMTKAFWATTETDELAERAISDFDELVQEAGREPFRMPLSLRISYRLQKRWTQLCLATTAITTLLCMSMRTSLNLGESIVIALGSIATAVLLMQVATFAIPIAGYLLNKRHPTVDIDDLDQDEEEMADISDKDDAIVNE